MALSIPTGEMPVPQEVFDFIETLTPDAVGREEFGDLVLRFEGFTDLCIEDATKRCSLPSQDPRHLSAYDAVYAEVLAGWFAEEGREPFETGFSGGEDNPIQWAVYERG